MPVALLGGRCSCLVISQRAILPPMVKLRLAQLLKQRKLTGYRLAKLAGLSLPTVYKLSKPSGEFTRLEADTIDKICAALNCSVAELIVRVPDKGK